ncbi:MAG: amidohydrolase family protein [Bullifex sp.]
MKTLITGAEIHTFTSDGTFSYMGIMKGMIIYLGNERPSGKWHEVKLEGLHIAPRLFDSHIHLLYTIVLAGESFTLSTIRGTSVTPDSAEAALNLIRQFALSHPDVPVIVANGFIPSAFEKPRLLTKTELDEAAPGRAVIVYTIDGHSSSLSSAMLSALSIVSSNGVMRGEEHEFIQGKVTDYIASKVTPSVLAKGISSFVNTCTRYGISGVSALDGNEDSSSDVTMKLLTFIASRLSMNIRLYPQYTSYDKAKPFFRIQKEKRIGGCGAWELDGSVNSHSAAFFTPYRDTADCGHPYRSDSFVRGKVKHAVENNILLTAHAIGPAAIDQIVNAYQDESGNLPRNGALYRIDHFEFPSREAVEKVKQLPLAITIQPGFSYIDRLALHSYEKYLTGEQISLMMPLKSLSDAGVCLLGSSDSPVQDMDPFLQMKGMTHYYIEDESISSKDAYCTYSVNSGRANGEDYTLITGNEATFAVFSKDPEKEELSADDCLGLWRKGKKVKEIKHPLAFLLSLIFRKKHKI